MAGVRDAAAMPPTVSEPPPNHAIRTSAHAYRIGKLAKALCRGRCGPSMASGHRGRQRRWLSVTMGTMSASDAAPLPRLGEVFFDVRGNSRSMRLSWYADTGVAVLSIWQGGMCTGTFRLAIADLPRMVETLQRGPGGQQPGWDAGAPGQAFADAPADATAQVHAMGPLSGQMMQPAPSDFPDNGADQGEYRSGTTDYLAEPLDRRSAPGPAGYPGEPQPPDRRGAAPDYLADPPDPRAGPPEYPSAFPGRPDGPAQYPAEPPGQRQDPRSGPVGYPGEPQPPDRRGGGPDYLADPLEALGQLGVPDAPRTPDPYQSGARDYLTGPPPEQRPGPSEYLTEPPPEQRPRPYLTQSLPDQRAKPAEYPTEPPQDPRDSRGRPAEYLSEPPQDPRGPRGRPAEYLSEPPQDPRGRPAEYLSEPPLDPRAGQTDYLTGPSAYPGRPPEQRSDYLADLPVTANADDRAGYGADFHAGSSYPGAGDSGAYPRGPGRQATYPGEPASDPYLAGTGPLDYPGEAPVSHYPGGSSASRSEPSSAAQSDPLGPSTADYPVHYGAALTDDMADEPPVESSPYQRRRGSR
jgi:hypothetical protein